MVDITKMVEDGKHSPHAAGAFVFYLQNIANLIRSLTSPAAAKELADEIHARGEDMANVVFKHHAATAPVLPAEVWDDKAIEPYPVGAYPTGSGAPAFPNPVPPAPPPL